MHIVEELNLPVWSIPTAFKFVKNAIILIQWTKFTSEVFMHLEKNIQIHWILNLHTCILLDKRFKWTQIPAGHLGWGKRHLPDRMLSLSQQLSYSHYLFRYLKGFIRLCICLKIMLWWLIFLLDMMKRIPSQMFLLKKKQQQFSVLAKNLFSPKEMDYIPFSPGKNRRI